MNDDINYKYRILVFIINDDDDYDIFVNTQIN